VPGFYRFSPAKFDAVRLERGISQRRLSLASGIATSTIWLYKVGQREPQPRNIVRLALALDVAPSDLCDADPIVEDLEAVAR
jgi:transcriptional regulator with XRE-family HTH domain